MVPNVNIIFGLFVVAACLVFAYFAAFTDTFAENFRMNGNKRTIFVVLLLAYSGYRSYRLYKAYRQQLKDRDDRS